MCPSALGRWARAQAVTSAAVLAAVTVVAALVLGGVVLAVPGVPDAFPGTRLLPSLAAASGVLVLAEPWRDFEVAAVLSLRALRSARLGAAIVIATATALVVGIAAGSSAIALTGVLTFAVLVVLVSTVGRYWWVGFAAAAYGQLQVHDLEHRDLPPLAALVGLVAASALYVCRGERGPGGEGSDRSPT